MAKPLPAQAAAETRWRDLREWLALVDALGELKRVTGANSEEDIGAITEMLDHAEGSPCVLFDEIPNFKPGYRVLVNSMGSRKRQAVTLGLDPAEASHDRLATILARAFERFCADSAGGRQTRSGSRKHFAR